MKLIKVLFKRHKKHLPDILIGTYLGEFLRFGALIFVSAWILQGIHYMNWREAVLKFLLDVVLILLFVLFGCSLYYAFLISHSINFAINGQLVAMFTHMGAGKSSPESFIQNTLTFAEDCNRFSSLSAVMAYGSLSRGNYKKTSDIDVRIVPKNGEIFFWMASFVAIRLRFKAFRKGYPLDLYIFDENEIKRKMRTDEPPIVLNDRCDRSKSWYEETISISEFEASFRAKNKSNEGL